MYENETSNSIPAMTQQEIYQARILHLMEDANDGVKFWNKKTRIRCKLPAFIRATKCTDRTGVLRKASPRFVRHFRRPISRSSCRGPGRSCNCWSRMQAA